MNYAFVLALDPSGSFHEGKGTTGWAIMECAAMKITKCGNIRAVHYDTKEIYWQAHLALLETYYKKYGKRLFLVIEDYILYESKVQCQINSHMETSKLIGIMQHYCWNKGIPYGMQLAAEVKKRWTNEILHYKQYIAYQQKRIILPNNKDYVDKHCMDAIRHAVHFATFKNKLKKVN